VRDARAVKLGVIADSHVSVERFDHTTWHNEFDLRGSRDLLDRALRHELLDDAEAVLILGDLVHWGDRASLGHVVDAVDAAGRAAFLLQGNHDVLVPGVRLEDEAASAKMVATPFRADNPDAPFEPFHDAGIAFEVHEVRRECERGARWPFEVARRRLVDAPADAPAVVATHFPALSLRRDARAAELLYSGHLTDLADAHDCTLPAARPTIVLSGHLHIRGVVTEGPVLQIVFAALVEAPYDVAAVEITRDHVGYRCASIKPVDVDRVPVLAPPTASWHYDAADGTWSPAAT
jgi:hypothetical protein